jgi:carnitine 3-dehydrogenase
LKALEARLYADAAALASSDAASPGLARIDTYVRPEWVDYNGHMSDFRYLQVFGDAMDVLYRQAGVDEAYRRKGRMLYTVDTQISYLAEAKVNEPLYATTHVLSVDDKRLKVQHHLHRGRDDKLIATAMQTHVHVDTAAGKACAMEEDLYKRFEAIRAAQPAAARG